MSAERLNWSGPAMMGWNPLRHMHYLRRILRVCMRVLHPVCIAPPLAKACSQTHTHTRAVHPSGKPDSPPRMDMCSLRLWEQDENIVTDTAAVRGRNSEQADRCWCKGKNWPLNHLSWWFFFSFSECLQKCFSRTWGREIHTFVDSVLLLSSSLLCCLCANKISGLYFLRSLH